ncbi:nuclear transport factor 2 family protein [Parafrigoribacterium humi]|uniref:nuclear transport factor 2 family protein n=1 Tax=Parafrigoribacterium humi TaxID=3144664 RepID=UPI0032EE8BB5
MLSSQENKQIFNDIIVAIWYDVDLGDSTNVQYFFTPDGVLSFDGREIHGRQAIHDGYQSRRSNNQRLSRHIITNVHVVRQDEKSADVVSTLHLFAGNGVPVLPNTDPLSVTDTFDHFVKDAEGNWLIESRLLRNLFVREGAVFVEPPSK